MLRVLSSWRKPDKQAAYDAALERGAKLGIKDWVLPREKLELGAKYARICLIGVAGPGPSSQRPLLVRRLGSGGFGVVFKCSLDGKAVVAKQIAPARLAPKDLPLLQNEMCLWAQLDHPNCVKFFGVIFDPTDYYYLICEYMPGGSLFERHHKLRSQSKQPKPPSSPQLLADMRQIARAMEHLHAKNILHRDLKSANVLVDDEGRLCVADFGLVRYCESEKVANMTAETGSYRWMAPEVIRHEPYGTGCDVYSFAVLCWEMMSYSIPFPHHTPVEVALSVATKGLRPELPAYVPNVVADLIKQCWQQDALLRPSFEQVCSRIDAIDCASALRELPDSLGEKFDSRPQSPVGDDSSKHKRKCSQVGDDSSSGPGSGGSPGAGGGCGGSTGARAGGRGEDAEVGAMDPSYAMKRPKSVDSNLASYSAEALKIRM